MKCAARFDGQHNSQPCANNSVSCRACGAVLRAEYTPHWNQLAAVLNADQNRRAKYLTTSQSRWAPHGAQP